MKKIALLVFFLTEYTFLNCYGQTVNPNYQDGLIYLKVNTETVDELFEFVLN